MLYERTLTEEEKAQEEKMLAELKKKKGGKPDLKKKQSSEEIQYKYIINYETESPPINFTVNNDNYVDIYEYLLELG